MNFALCLQGLHKLRLTKAGAALTLAASILFSSPAFTQADTAAIDELRAQIAALNNRLDQLEQENASLNASAATGETASTSRPDSWTDNISISGDLRPRFEHIDDGARSSDRNRNRVRARVNIEADLGDNWSGGVGLASGDDDPISTNQSLGNGGSTKDLRLDRAYVTYSGFAGTELTAGKYSNVFFKPGGQNLIFDGDYRPEGVALEYARDALFFNAGTMILEGDDRHDGQDKESIWGLQLGWQVDLDAVDL
ncbi:MAG: putative porin, partial [Gammaproteobacteria bacterium]